MSNLITSSGGQSPYTYNTTSGTLPPTLALSSSGLVSGTASAAGIYTFTVASTDFYTNTGSRTYSITITTPTITLSPITLLGGISGSIIANQLSCDSASFFHIIPVSGTSYESIGTQSCSTCCTTLNGLGIGQPWAWSDLPFLECLGFYPPGPSGSTHASGYFSWNVKSFYYSWSNPGGGIIAPESYLIYDDYYILRIQNPFQISPAQTVIASGGTGPYTYIITSGSLPTGMILTPSGSISGSTAGSGSIEGMPSATGSFTFVITAIDAYHSSGSASYSMFICPQLPIIPATLTSPTSSVGTAYSQTFSTIYGTVPKTWITSSGTIPTGLTFASNSLSASISGTPTVTGSYTYVVRITDANGCNSSSSYTQFIYPNILLSTISSSNITCIGYSQTITSSGGIDPYTYSTSSGTIPTGLALSSSGLLYGSGSSTGIYSFTASATDSRGFTGSKGYTITVTAPVITLQTITFPGGISGSIYTSTLITSSGGTAPYIYSVISGSTPTGLALSSSGLVFGTASATGSFTFVANANDNCNSSGSASYSISVCSNLTILPTSLGTNTTGSVGSDYSQSFSTTYGTVPRTWITSSGAIPTGLTFASNSISSSISGTPTETGSYTYVVRITDASGCNTSSSYTTMITGSGGGNFAISMSSVTSTSPEVTQFWPATGSVDIWIKLTDDAAKTDITQYALALNEPDYNPDYPAYPTAGGSFLNYDINNGWGLVSHPTTTQSLLMLATYHTPTSNLQQHKLFFAPFTSSQFNHIRFSWDTSSIRLYRDGILASTSSNQYSASIYSAFGYGTPPSFNQVWGSSSYGIIVDEFRISNIVRTSGSVIGQQYFTSSDSGNSGGKNFTVDANTLVYIKFNEGAGNLAYDTSGNSVGATGSSNFKWVAGV